MFIRGWRLLLWGYCNRQTQPCSQGSLLPIPRERTWEQGGRKTDRQTDRQSPDFRSPEFGISGSLDQESWKSGLKIHTRHPFFKLTSQ